MNISIVIPILNEKNNIKEIVSRIRNQFDQNQNVKLQIIFVDDNSQDGTEEIFNEIADKNLKLIVRKENPKDLSKSCVLGFDNAIHENIMVMDGDLQHDPSDIIKLIKTFQTGKYDIVFGCRDLSSRNITNLNPLRFILSKLLNNIFNILFNKNFKDPMSGFFIMKKEIYYSCKDKLHLKGYKILADIILSTERNLSIEEVIINFHVRHKGFSKMSPKILFQLIVFLLFKFCKKLFNKH